MFFFRLFLYRVLSTDSEVASKNTLKYIAATYMKYGLCNLLSQAGLCSQGSCTTLQLASHSLEPPNEQHPEKLSLALEPESAAIYCQMMKRNQLAQHCQASEPFTASSYLIIDIGGGTVDISAHPVVEKVETYIHVVYPPTGNDCGGTRVNKEFRGFLQTLVQDEGFQRFLCTGDESVPLPS